MNVPLAPAEPDGSRAAGVNIPDRPDAQVARRIGTVHAEPDMNLDQAAPKGNGDVSVCTPFPSLLVMTSVDGALRESPTGPCTEVRRAMAMLSTHDVPVILASHHSAPEFMEIQTTLGLTGPFIADGASSLYVPRSYFGDTPRGRVQSTWDVIDCASSRRIGEADCSTQAVRLLVSLYRVHRADVLVVGVGCGWQDCGLLSEVDVPIIVRQPGDDHGSLIRTFPSAYVTKEYGPLGWIEAVLGSADA